MKKILISATVAMLCSLTVHAQDASNNATATTVAKPSSPDVGRNSRTAQNWRNMPVDQKMRTYQTQTAQKENVSAEDRVNSNADKKEMRQERKEARQEMYNNASPELKARMDEHRAMMEKLSPEKREAVKAEMKRHREAMKAITGVDLPMPPEPNDNQRENSKR